MDYEALFPGRFLKSAQFKGREVTLTIAGIRIEELEGDKGKKAKGIVSFVGKPIEWVLNRTNAECLKALFGRETDHWVGKRVTLWPAPYTDNMTGEVSTAIRVRGSPDIAANVSFELKLARKKAAVMTLQKTGPSAGPDPELAATP